MTLQRDDFEIRNLVADVFKHGGEIREDEPAATRRRPGFSAFVLWPALVFGGVTLTGAFGLITVIFALGVKSGAWGEWGYWRVSLGLAATVAAGVAGWVLVVLTGDWRDLQWRVKRVHIDEDTSTPEPFVDRIERVDSGHLIGLKAPWVSGWKQKLAKRVYDKGHHGRWIGGATIARDRHLKGLYGDLTGNYETALDDLRRLGWLDGKEWTDKGKADIKGYLFYGGNDGRRMD
jgi:hypothetical protein